jgi:parvulin-like peptidyl-prolyl isomerase
VSSSEFLRRGLTLACICLGLLAASPAGAQTREFLYLPPVRPLWPTDENQCKALDAEWAAIRKDIDQRHSACLTAQSNTRRPESGKACSFLACEPYHGASSLGRTDVESCREAVRKHKENLRKQEEEKRAAEEEAKRAEREAARAAQERADRIEAEKVARDRKRDEDAARRQREKDERERRQKADARTMALAQEAKRAEQEMLDARNREREERTAKLEEESNAAADRLASAANTVASRIESVAGVVKDAIAGIGSGSAANPSGSGSDFDIPDENADSDPASFFADIGGIVVPWSGINFSIIRNASEATGDLTREIGNVLSDFDNADPARLEAAFAEFPQRVFGLKPILTAIAENAVSSAVTEYAIRAVSPAIEAATIRERLRPAHESPPAGNSRYSWFTEKPAARQPVTQDGGRRAWVRQDAVFLPSVDAGDESPYEDIVKEWVVGYWVGRTLSNMQQALR